MTGTLINIVTVSLGSILGLILKNRLPESYKQIILQGVGLVTIILGVQMALKTQNLVIALSSLLIGGLIGQFLQIDQKMNLFSEHVKKRFARPDDHLFTEGLITASLIFCVGPMTIVGSINDGLYGNYDLLFIKSVLDGFTSIALSATFGIGVFFSVFTVLIIQGGISFFASNLEYILQDGMINEMTAVGGLMILGIGFLLLDIKKINVANFLPALAIAPLILAIKKYLGF